MRQGFPGGISHWELCNNCKYTIASLKVHAYAQILQREHINVTVGLQELWDYRNCALVHEPSGSSTASLSVTGR